MNLKFVDWYTQALGAACGLVACIYAYLNGFMFVYGNINNHFDYLGFDGVLGSYFLYPLCIVCLILAVIKYFLQRKDIVNLYFESLNIFIIVATTIIGFVGAKIYFLIPALLITFNISRHYIPENKELKDKFTPKVTNVIKDNRLKPKLEDTILASKKVRQSNSLINTKKEMAITLLENHSNTQFIKEITGLSIEEINTISNEINQERW